MERGPARGAAPIRSHPVNANKGSTRMNKVLAALVGATMVLSAGMAVAAEVKGAIKAMNMEARTVVIDTTTVTFPQAISLSGYIVGTAVTITYTTAGTTNTATAIAKVAK